MAKRHVAATEIRCDWQRELVQAQGAGSRPDVAAAAKRVLVTMESTLSLLRAMQMDEHLYAQEALSDAESAD
jgi:hypothetical protein